MNNETPPLDLAHLKALYEKGTKGPWHGYSLNSILRWARKNSGPWEDCPDGHSYPSDDDSDLILALHDAFPQLCRELEESKSYVFQQAKIITKTLLERDVSRRELATLQSQLSKAEGERDRMRGTLTHALEALRRHIPEGHGSHPNPEYEIVYEVESALQPLPQTEGREDHKEFLAWILQNCKIIHWPGGGHYPIEHAPAANKDGVMLLQMAMNRTGMYAKALYEPTPAPVSEKGPMDSPEGLRPRIEK